MGLFKTTSNGVFVDTINGSDITGDGSRNNPYATLNRVGAGYQGLIILSGKSIESGLSLNSGAVSFTGDGEHSVLTANLNNITGTGYTFSRLKLLGDISSSYKFTINACIVTTITGGNTSSAYLLLILNSFIYNFRAKGFGTDYLIGSECKNNTIVTFSNYILSNNSRVLKDSVLLSELNLYNFTSRANTTCYPIFQNCLFRKATLWKWNTTTISINWTNNPVGGAAYDPEVTLMTRVYNSLLFYANSLGVGTDKTYFLAILATQDTMFKECVVWDDSDTVNNPIFSRYVDGVPVDYTLALKSNNPALYMSTTGSYVGCYAANVNDDGHGNHITFGSVKHVDTTTGLDTATLPDLLVQDPSNPAKFGASQTSLQLWNRIRTSVVEYPRGKSFAGMQSQLDSGVASRLFFGKRQEIRTTGDISQKTTAFESVEVIPYDSLPTPNTGAENTINNMSATLPRFSAPFNGECLLFYRNKQPLLFNQIGDLFQGTGTVSITSGSQTVTGVSTTFTTDFVKDDCIQIGDVWYKVLSIASNTSMTLFVAPSVSLSTQTYRVGICTDKDLSIYGTWAVSNADIESYSLLQKVTKAGLSTSIPLIKWCKFELNLHYDEE